MKMLARGQIELSAYIQTPWGSRNICSNMSFSPSLETERRTRLVLKFRVNEQRAGKSKSKSLI